MSKTAGDLAALGLGGFETEMLRAFDGALAPVAVLTALVVGAAHALRPGHGKTMVAAYLLAEHGRRRHAVALALVVAGMHTASVLVLGLLWWLTAGESAVSIQSVTRWGQLLVAVIVLCIGSLIARRRWRAFVGHGHGHGHGHAPPEGAPPWSRAGLAGIASVGALLPSPSAFLVLISGLLTGRAGLAIAMVIVFGVGLGATVLITGLVVLSGRDWLDERALRYGWLGSFARYVPVAGGCVVLAGGCVLAVVAVTGIVNAA